MSLKETDVCEMDYFTQDKGQAVCYCKHSNEPSG